MFLLNLLPASTSSARRATGVKPGSSSQGIIDKDVKVNTEEL